mmetsp:Transcript_5049/g.8278  ORF Transcript_5049/g.8278 Transcript_5049/m.8278 type:complete len:556 (+) Transcript_5049:111-1778(+)|eukprot:CAMPEP_0114413020 /NCGR_PEP_ID=MMETSP0103-20121206/634_1 /TAXON_ID=37642 ORGANISM="Paraphysomonas imperforata, Strain PA2" /NCGR_SAMPLE_ID=MMETSP0103 /ASSEMBLY_ACC=CAM_ASM_000201 /LENGTH=555 /DNA_ID=CAMNT_0001581071 /DNA_START=88 /DNA_END=1755 /DNA_ORIENTATION=-
MSITEIIFTANFLDPPLASSFSNAATCREVVWVHMGFSAPDEGTLAELSKTLQLTCPVVSDHDEVLRHLSSHAVCSLPWKVTLGGNDGPHGIPLSSLSPSPSPVAELMREGVKASNEQDDFSRAARCFSTVLALPPAVSAADVDPQHVTVVQLKDALFNMASLMHMHGLLPLVLPLLERLLLLEGGASDLTAHAFLWSLAQGIAAVDQGQSDTGTTSDYLHSLVVAVYSRLAQRGDVLAARKHRALTGRAVEGGTEKGDPQYASLIFDDMAEVFEKRLVQDLKYDCPWRMQRLIDELLKTSNDLLVPLPSAVGQWRVLDIGCGSGLVGRLFTRLVGLPPLSTQALLQPTVLPTEEEREGTAKGKVSTVRGLETCAAGPCMVGVDISEKMALLAQANGGYTVTLCDDLDKVLRCFGGLGETGMQLQALDMVVAADTFLYVGPLEETFSLVSQALRLGGLFLFSTEDLDASPMRRPKLDTGGGIESERGGTPNSEGSVGVELLSSARYAHSQGYIEQLAKLHGFLVMRVEELVIRTEASVPLPGKIFALQLNGSTPL